MRRSHLLAPSLALSLAAALLPLGRLRRIGRAAVAMWCAAVVGVAMAEAWRADTSVELDATAADVARPARRLRRHAPCLGLRLPVRLRSLRAAAAGVTAPGAADPGVSGPRPLRVAVYADNWYRPTADGVYADRSLVLFIAGVAAAAEHTILLGQLDPDLPRAHYRVPDHVEFVGLPPYPSMLSLRAPAGDAGLAARRSGGCLDKVDVVWLLGPHPLCLAFAALAALRGKRVTLGVRQDFPTYVRTRHPGRRLVHLAGDLLEGAYRLIARRAPTVVVGPDLAANFRRARHLLPISVSLVRDSDIADPAEAANRLWNGEHTVLSVGRLETEKNPLLLADVLARLARRIQRTGAS